MKELLKKYRRDLHKIPELGFEEYKTKAYILNILKEYNCEIINPYGTAVCAYFKCKNKNNETIAFRGDMDALPITESTGLDFSSSHSGLMHACGHDGHIAMILGLAYEIEKNLNKLPCNVLLIFQPAEEGGGGAQKLCDTGILSKYNVSKIYGYHLWPGVEKYAIASRPHALMAKTTEMDIIIKGKSAHCANADKGIDSLYIGCQFLCDIYKMVETEVPKDEFKLLKFGKAESGTIRNIISAYTHFYGTMRCFNMDIFDFMLKRIKETAKNYEEKYKCNIIVEYNEGYPPVINDPEVFKDAENKLSKEFIFKNIEIPYMQAEDFSFYLQEIPGMFMFLGIGDTYPLHSDKFNFDEDVLELGVKAYKKLLGI
ncbi:M20 metallopeptidase family protein [Anaerovorax odorimutans]|uniref:M20 metallopeptidase family protein n=1 Tax=Anaerovorax odorimutans TaxID=109327 RepID=UPI0004122499|nr:amidohydrolase [Anaerovorax odorimutans]